MKKILFKRGFSIIELLVVIAIIAILTAIITSNFATSKSKSRDAKRVSDIAQIQLALEMAFDKCNAYPQGITVSSVIPLDPVSGTFCTKPGSNSNYTLGDFISVVPKESATQLYTYAKNSTAPFVDYVLRAKLENDSSVLIDDIDGTVFGTDCSDSANGYYYCVQPK
ncbi:prepilin-type N-terminal cleavage/methylation domain-containing protein [bacterium]|nr:prepilin-type N-terminal cleavage/methylation domain-containing protein [bacterium]